MLVFARTVNIHFHQNTRVSGRAYVMFFSVFVLVVDEQNAHTDEQDLQSPTDFKKDTEEENKDNEKDEDTKELEALPCEFSLHLLNRPPMACIKLSARVEKKLLKT